MISSLPEIKNYKIPQTRGKLNYFAQRSLFEPADSRYSKVCNDSISFKGGFTTLERKLMEEVTVYGQVHGAETERVIDRKGCLADFKVTEAPMYCYLECKDEPEIFGIHIEYKPLSKFIQKRKKFHILNGSVRIHSHLFDAPLSAADILALFYTNAKKTIATTPGGYYSLMERPTGHLNTYLNNKRFREAMHKLKVLQLGKAVKLELVSIDILRTLISHFEKAEKSKISEYSKFSIGLLQEFADAMGCRFEHNFNV